MIVLQSSCHMWNTERRKLLTASNFDRVCKMRATTSCKNLVHSISYANFSTKGTQYGIANEPVAKRKMAEEHDGLACEDAIMEVKCPLSADKYEVRKMLSIMASYCPVVNRKVLLERGSNYYYQVQGQLYITGRKNCYFMVYTSRWMTYEITENDEFWSNRRAQSLFYKECLLEELVNPQFTKMFVKADIQDPIYITTAQQKAKSATRKRHDI
ncbi:hypothetical protein PR048_008993 [Dryococelus australis]|uniref:YqaJ viral recombinase domain-containing protein n=1 Tax=Dryococelus australis TaxID=614101 RepID=A0ABQ9HZJ7_9NEOP|nr:hypothetical protein PR048_008993 [Dryococelus australis]